MIRVTADKLAVGMKLAKPLLSPNGMVIMAEGTELTERLIDRIVDMQLPFIYVEGSVKPDIPKEELLAELESRFRYVIDKPYMGLLKKTVHEHIEALYE